MQNVQGADNGGKAGLKLAVALAFVLLVSGISTAPARAMSTDQEVACLAQTIYFESRGEPQGGMLAVGHVVMNRAHDPGFPHSICGVVHQRSKAGCQFTFACDRRSDQPRGDADWAQSMKLARMIYSGQTKDPTDGALWFHRASARADLGPGTRRTAKIGRHVFYSRRSL
jgi:spore germination cell wall hydrolase CwlJ-like protein